MFRRLLGVACAAFIAVSAHAQEVKWSEVLAKARGQTVNFNAWAGDEKTNAFIQWAGEEVGKRYGVKINHVKLKDTAEAVTRVVAEKAAGRNSGGTVDLIWINGPNFLALKQQGLLHGPFTQALPNYARVDTTGIRSNVVDFTIPVDGLESPWRRAQIVFVYDSKRVSDAPRSVPEMLAWAKRHPGRLTHPSVRNFLGSTFLKQALYGATPGAPGGFTILNKPLQSASFAGVVHITEPAAPGDATYHLIAVPLPYLALLLALPPVAWLVTTLRHRHRRRAGCCANCGYDLRATSGRCPECGANAPAAGTMAAA